MGQQLDHGGGEHWVREPAPAFSRQLVDAAAGAISIAMAQAPPV